MFCFAVKYINIYTNIVLLRCSRDHHAMVWSALTLMNSLKKRPCVIRLLHLGGKLEIFQHSLMFEGRYVLAKNILQYTIVANFKPWLLMQKIWKSRRKSKLSLRAPTNKLNIYSSLFHTHNQLCIRLYSLQAHDLSFELRKGPRR